MTRLGLWMRVVLGALAFVCASPPAAVSASQKEAGQTVVIGMVVPNGQYPFFVEVRKGAEEAAAKLGARITFQDSDGDPEGQVSVIQSFISQKVDGILVSPASADLLVPSINDAAKTGIPVATVGARANSGKVLVQVESDDAAGGRVAAQYIIEKLGNKGSVIELEGFSPSTAAAKRKAGFEKAIAGSHLKIISTNRFPTAFPPGSTGFDAQHSEGMDGIRPFGREVIATMIQEHQEFDAIFASNDLLIIGAVDALTAANVDPSSKVTVGFDAIPDALQYIKDGKLSGTVGQSPAEQAARAVQYLVGYIRNKAIPPQKVVLITPELVTKVPAGGT